MKIKPVLLAAYIGFIFYSIITFFWGDSGIIPMRNLYSYRENLEINFEILREKNRVLESTLNSLQTDPETVRLQARSLGFIEESEVLIIADAFESEQSLFKPGTIPGIPENPQSHTLFFRKISLLTFLFLSFIFILFRGILPDKNS